VSRHPHSCLALLQSKGSKRSSAKASLVFRSFEDASRLSHFPGHNAHGAHDALRNLNSATAKNDLLPFSNVGKKAALLSPTAMICDVSDKNNPSQNAAHRLYYKHICRKTVATRCG